MKTRGNKLEIFENFEIDRKLPKYKKKEDSNSFNAVSGIVQFDGSNDSWSIDLADSDGGRQKRDNIFIRLYNKLFNIARPKKKRISIKDFFFKFSTEFQELSQVSKIGEHYEKAIQQGERLNQVALVERLKKQLDVVKGEAYLIAMGLTKYVTEEQVLKLYELTDEDKHLKLTYVKNYVKMIPSDIISTKDTLDDKAVFDNYVILHYDPYNDSVMQTEKEIEKEKDPILFGVIKDSRKLYYVGDWIDEVCDLTLDKMMNELGDEALEINNKTLKTYIDQNV